MGRAMSVFGSSFLAAFLCSIFVVTSTNPTNLESDQPAEDQKLLHREERFFIFPFIQFGVTESVCNTSNGEQGTCYTRQKCTNKQGTASGNCQNGRGVCCIVQNTCGTTTKRNNTYLVNDNYPESYTGTTSCFYGIERLNNNICQVRLDFVSMTLVGPESTNGVCNTDTLTITSNPSFNPPVICGENTGQHMYIEFPSSTSSVRINIATGGNTFDRKWRIKVTQIPCTSAYRAPANCLQYFTDPTGTITSFNYVDTSTTTQQLAKQDYSACVKVQEGFCSITYKETNTNSFSLSKDPATPTVDVGTTDCANDYVGFFSDTNDRFCGSLFNEVESSDRPFILHVKSDDVEPATDVNNKGFSLDYSQSPC
ncbi:uncharacterized protein LOC143036065 [Oratosquilla oratoria]|uniref:uncharacterized protein LOC143036065 n=1 Tax=Oratosquilla oratoria TaxID=337810 RepID=UPI003F75CCFB